MPAEIFLATEPVTATAVSKQPLTQAIVVTRYKSLALLLRVLATVGGNVTVRIITGMQNDTYDGWVVLGTYTPTAGPANEKVDMSNALKYILWEVSAIGTSATFTVQGIAREN